MEYKHITYQPGKVARLILNRPRYFNAQSRLLLEEMDDAFARAEADNEVGVIVLSGEGKHFSSGHDLGTPEEVEDRKERGFPTDGHGNYLRLRKQLVESALRWRNLQKPTIAMVHGYCIFGGWMIASAMDVIFASEDALFLPSHSQYFPVPWDIGARKAKEILFEHRFITAREACTLNFVNRVYPKDKLEEETLAYAGRVAENDPFNLRTCKYSINHMMDAMGFTSEIEAAFQAYFINRHMGYSQPEQLVPPVKSIARVEQALRNLELRQNQP